MESKRDEIISKMQQRALVQPPADIGDVPGPEESAETFEGLVAQFLESKSKLNGTPFSCERLDFGRTVFHFGDEKAYLQLHVDPETGIAQHHTPILDLQKTWWREALESIRGKKNLVGLGLMLPSLLELVDRFRHGDAQSFQLSTLLKGTGMPTEGIAQELSESSLGSRKHPDLVMRKLVDAMIGVLNPALAPEFQVAFDTGNGHFERKIRILPQTENAVKTLRDGGPEFEALLDKIVQLQGPLAAKLQSTLK